MLHVTKLMANLRVVYKRNVIKQDELLLAICWYELIMCPNLLNTKERVSDSLGSANDSQEPATVASSKVEVIDLFKISWIKFHRTPIQIFCVIKRPTQRP